MMDKRILPLMMGLVVAAVPSCETVPSDVAIREEALKQQRVAAAVAQPTTRTTQTICAGQRVPRGWIKVNDHWDPTRCGSPTRIVYNVWTIEKFADKPRGATMKVCASARTPRGWVVINTSWDPTKCGHPSQIRQNMKTIRRVN